MWKVEFISNKPQLLTVNLELKVMCDLSHSIQNLKRFDMIKQITVSL